MSEEGFKSWAIVEVMGHNTYSGYVTEEVIAGVAFVRVDVPEVDSHRAGETIPAFTKFVGPGSIYALTPTTEETARASARYQCKLPVQIYELVPRAALRALPRGDEADEPAARWARCTRHDTNYLVNEGCEECREDWQRHQREEDDNYETAGADKDDRPTCGCLYCHCLNDSQAGEICEDCQAGAHQG